MKKRLLSLLLAMVMIVSMVPVQAFAEEADASELLEPAVVEEAAPEDVSEITEESAPETTGETVPETTVETVPETTEETVPETTEETVPETTEETVPETTEEIIPESTEELLLEQDSVDEIPAEGAGDSVILVTPAELSLRAGDDAALQAKLPTEEAVENDGIVYELAEGAEQYATLEGNVLTIKKGFAIPKGQTYAEFTVFAKAADEESAVQPAVITVKAYAKLSGIALYVNDSEKPTTTHTVNIASEVKSFTVDVKATDGGPLALDETTWTDPSTNLLTKSIGDGGVHTYTAKNKTGTATIKVASKTDKKVAAALTVKLVTAPTSFEIKELESFDKIGVSTLRAGTKVTLTTDIGKNFTDRNVKWEVGPYVEPLNSEEVPNEGMAIEGDNQLASFVTIDQKGVLKTSANILGTMMVTVKASLISNPAVCDTIDILVQPAVNSFWVELLPNAPAPLPGEVETNTAVNRKDNEPWYWDLNDGGFTLKDCDFSPYKGKYYVNWKVSVKSNVAKYEVDPEDPNVVYVFPKAPGKLTFTATAADGSDAKYSGTVEFYGETRVVDISAPETMQAGDKPVTLTVKAYYDDKEAFQIAKPNLYWDVVELRKIDNIDAKDDADRPIYKDENGDIYPWVYVDGTDYYDRYPTTTTVKNGKLTLGRITQNTKLLVSVYGEGYPIKWNEDGEPIEWDCAEDHVVIDVTVPEDSKSLVIATAYWNEKEEIVPDWAFTETETMTGSGFFVVPALMDANGNLEPAEGAKLTVKGSAKKDEDYPDFLYFYKDGTATITATLGKQKATATVSVRMPATFVEINNPATDGKLNSPVTAGKSVKLTATSKHKWQANDPEGESQEAKASVQKFEWYLLKQGVNVEDDKWVDYFYDCVTVENDAAKINTKTGVLTAKNVEKTTEVQAVVIDSERNTAAVTVTILPKDKTFVTVNGAAVPATYSVNTSAKLIPISDISVGVLKGGDSVTFTKEKVTVSPASLAKVTKDGIQLTGKTGTLTISVKGTIDGQTKPVTVKASIKLYNSVTSIEIVRPKNKKGNELPLLRGKPLKLTANVNKDATNKKLVWHVSRDPGYEDLWYGDKTTIKDGVLKADKSWYDDNGVYYVWATATDGSGISSEPAAIPVFSLTTSVVASIANADTYGELYFAENQVVTIQKGETGEFQAWTLNARPFISDAKRAEPVDVELTVKGDALFVKTADELVAFANAVNEEGKYAEATVVLCNDIDLAGIAWKPVGQTSGYSAKTYFRGTFDGQGHTIRNLTIPESSWEAGSNEGKNYATGFFGFIDAGNAVIKDVTFDNAKVVGHHWVGTVAGYMSGKIENVTVTNSTVTSSYKNGEADGDKAGAIAGFLNSGAITGCTAKNCTVQAVRDCGSIVGYTNDPITYNTAKDCTVYYSTEKEGQIGGIFTGKRTSDKADGTNASENVTVQKLVTVSTAEELSAALNAEYTADALIRVENDIVLESTEWGAHTLNLRSGAKVTIDGNGKTVSGLTTSTTTDVAGFESNGLISGVNTPDYPNGPGTVEVKDLTIDGATVSSSLVSKLPASAALVGSLNNTYFNAENITVTNANISSDFYAGGLIGYVQGNYYVDIPVNLKNCTITKSTFAGNDATGALVALNNEPTTITGAKVTGNIVKGGAGYSASALVGTAINDVTAVKVTMSDNTFDINSTNFTVADGIIGYVYVGKAYTVNGTELKAE